MGVHERPVYRAELPLKGGGGGLGQFANLTGGGEGEATQKSGSGVNTPMRTMAIHIPITVKYNFSFSFEQFTIFTVKSLFSWYGFFLKWRNKERKGINLLDTIFAKMVFEFSVYC